ncbi:unnamed protein product [Toxocara canis]|uniref:Secreted protein n=1 Tax=Toxocara canis TaxID=6265 RepID=A0A183UKA8_TOXCA|nr:unnamed protein product [Toxocara canis]
MSSATKVWLLSCFGDFWLIPSVRSFLWAGLDSEWSRAVRLGTCHYTPGYLLLPGERKSDLAQAEFVDNS